MRKILFLVLSSFLMLSACGRGHKAADVMDHDRMVDFLADAYLLEGFYAVETQYRYDVLPGHVLISYDSILAVHGLTRAAVEHSIDYYSHHLDEYEAIHNEVVARLEAERDSLDR